jgi:hypothetical protein
MQVTNTGHHYPTPPGLTAKFSYFLTYLLSSSIEASVFSTNQGAPAVLSMEPWPGYRAHLQSPSSSRVVNSTGWGEHESYTLPNSQLEAWMAAEPPQDGGWRWLTTWHHCSFLCLVLRYSYKARSSLNSSSTPPSDSLKSGNWTSVA